MTEPINFLERRTRHQPERETVLTNLRLAVRHLEAQPEPQGSDVFWEHFVEYHYCPLCSADDADERVLLPFHYQDCRCWWRARPRWWRWRLRYLRWALARL